MRKSNLEDDYIVDRHPFFMRRLVGKRSDEEEAELMRKYGGVINGRQKKKPSKSRAKVADGTVAVSVTEEDGKTKKTKFVSVFSDVGQAKTVKLPGRHPCQCQARMHQLINNCLKCGKVVCEQEGPGPCFVCGTLVVNDADQQEIDKGSAMGKQLKEALLAGEAEGPRSLASIGKGLEEARFNRDKLLGFDKDSARRTRVVDDQADYFNMENSPWISDEEREKLRKRREALLAINYTPRSQQKQTVTLDFAGRQILEEPETMLDRLKLEAEEEEELEANLQRFQSATDDFVLDTRTHLRPMYVMDESKPKEELEPRPLRVGRGRVDGDVESMADGGLCLSIQQPFASLLVAGIKKHEGRSWYSSHRGRLWVMAGGRPVEKDEIKRVEDFYHNRYGGGLPDALPIQYPSGCLVGCVDVLDCLPQEQYLEQFPAGAAEDAYVFVCGNARAIPIHIPLRGQPKVFQLPAHLHQAARKIIDQGLPP